MTEHSRGIAVAGAHRTIRVLAEGEGPFPGELVSRGDGVAVRVDVARLRGWPGWALAGAEHVAAPLDVALRADGQDVLLPWCVCTVGVHLAGRGEGEGPSRGETVTLAVSMLRGVVELAAERSGRATQRADPASADESSTDEERRGEWWLTDSGRPVFAIVTSATAGADTVGSAAARLLRDLERRIEDRALRRLLLRLADALQDPRRLRAEAARWEAELLEIAAPRPLLLAEDDAADPDAVIRQAPPRRSGQPLRRRDLRSVSAPGRRGLGGRRSTVERRRGRARQPRPQALQQAVSAGRHAVAGRLARFFGRLAPEQGRDARPAAAGRRRRWTGPALVAASAAAVIALAGAFWPAEGGSADAADRTAKATPTRTQHAASAEGDPTPTAGVTPTPTASDQPPAPGRSAQRDPARAGAELISAALRCRTAPVPSCGELWDGGPVTAQPVRDQKEPAVLIEDYGDIAALRSGSGAGAQMVVIIRKDAEWRIRDVYDIADPPSEEAGAP